MDSSNVKLSFIDGTIKLNLPKSFSLCIIDFISTYINLLIFFVSEMFDVYNEALTKPYVVRGCFKLSGKEFCNNNKYSFIVVSGLLKLLITIMIDTI